MKMLYSGKELVLLGYVAGLLSGMIISFASCSIESQPEQHITTINAK